MSSDLTFITNEPGKSLFERFKVLLGSTTRFLDCLVGYFYVSGFFKLYPALEKTEKIRILIGMKTDSATYDLLQKAGDQQELFSKSHAVINAVKILKANKDEPRQPITPDFYELLGKTKAAFQSATTIEAEEIAASYRGGSNESYILKRLKTADIRNCEAFTDDDEEFVRQIIRLIEDGALPRPTTKKVATALKKEIKPLKVLGILRRDIPREFFQSTRAGRGASRHAHSPREVILSSFLASPARGKVGN